MEKTEREQDSYLLIPWLYYCKMSNGGILVIDDRAEIPRGSRRAEAKITEDESHGSISNGREARMRDGGRGCRVLSSGWRTEHRCPVSHEDCRCRSPRGLAVPRQIEGRRSEEGGLNRAGQRVGHAKIFSLGRHCITYLLTYLLTCLLTYLHVRTPETSFGWPRNR